MALLNYYGKNILGVFRGEGEVIRLFPSINEIDDDVLNYLKNRKDFKALIDSGKIQIMFQKSASDGKTPITEMLANINNIYDTKLLKKIIENDGRDTVLKAAQKQLDIIKTPGKAKVEENEHFI